MNGYDKYTRILELTNGDPWRIAGNRVSKQQYAARTRGIEWKLDRERTVRRIAQSTHCALSGRRLVFEIDNIDSPSIDRKNSDRGYTSRNTQIVTSAVNKAKHDLTEQEFIDMCCDVAKKHGWVKR
jgi:hypothetical protein